VDDPDEAAVAVGLARREQRNLLRLQLILLPIQVVIALAWVVVFVRGSLSAIFGWFWVAVLIVLMAVVPFVLRRRQQVARRAAEANERIARRLP
jgi:uncharacterized membrane protein